MDSVKQIRAKLDLLKRELHSPAYKLSWTLPEDTLLEGWLSRGDQRMSEVIYGAWKNGTKIVAWQDQRQLNAWNAAYSGQNLNPDFYTNCPHHANEDFPWEHISETVRKKYFYRDYQRSLDGETHTDCRDDYDPCGIPPTFAATRREYPGIYWKCPEVKQRKKSN